MRRAIPKMYLGEQHQNKWISKEMYRLTNIWVEAWRETQRYKHLICDLVSKVQVLSDVRYGGGCPSCVGPPSYEGGLDQDARVLP